VIRLTFDRDIPPADANNAFDDADIDIFCIEECALFDVQLNEWFCPGLMDSL